MNTKDAQTRFGLLQIMIVLLALATAIIHFSLAIPDLWMFYLNALGYVTLAAALYLPQLSQYRGIIRWILIVYTAITILGWVVIGERNTIGYIDKIIEVFLIALLWMESRRK